MKYLFLFLLIPSSVSFAEGCDDMEAALRKIFIKQNHKEILSILSHHFDTPAKEQQFIASAKQENIKSIVANITPDKEIVNTVSDKAEQLYLEQRTAFHQAELKEGGRVHPNEIEQTAQRLARVDLEESKIKGQKEKTDNSKDPTGGFLLYKPTETGYEIVYLAVHPKLEKNGVGRALVESLVKDLIATKGTDIVTTVRETNTNTVLFLKKIGFFAIDVRRGHFKNPDEAGYVMEYRPVSPFKPNYDLKKPITKTEIIEQLIRIEIEDLKRKINGESGIASGIKMFSEDKSELEKLWTKYTRGLLTRADLPRLRSINQKLDEAIARKLGPDHIAHPELKLTDLEASPGNVRRVLNTILSLFWIKGADEE